MRFKVTLKRADGTQEKRVMEAPSRFAIYEEAQKEGAVVADISDKAGGFDFTKLASLQIGSGRVKTEERITFTKNLSAMLAAGLTLSRSLSVIERQSTNPALKKITLDLEDQVRKGYAFHEALAAHAKVFSKLFIAMTKAGEESGTLSDALKAVARQMDSSYTLTKKIRGAMIYPAIILIAIILIGILMLIYVVPTLSSTFKELGVELPLATRIIVGISDFMANNVIIVFGLFAAAFAGGYAFVKSKNGSKIVLVAALRVPIIGELVRETMSARAARTLSSLLSSGVEMLSALEIAGEVVGDNIFGKVIAEAAVRVKKGDSLSAAFTDHANLYPYFVSDMIAVGEETGKVSDMLGQVAEYYETDVEERTKDLSTIIEPVLMLVIGAAVGVFALAMISPIYSLSDKI
ncbi:MAG TPA: type II secretion system F family protein [Candidatus Paceibacterota bacterium]|nr:type II secretion system F family protein [Candidatus Paceibacterota bacterium]